MQPQAVAPEPVYTDPGYTQPQSYSQEYSEGWSEPQTAAPVEVEPAVVESAPVPVETVEVKRIAPIEAPEGKILIGHALFDRPGFISEDDAERFNNTAAALQADGGNLLTDLGVDASQADRATAGAIAGGATGAVIGASVAGIPPALLGAAVGAGTGGLIGWTIGGAGATPASYVLAPQGAAIGAGVGAAVAGIPTALIGGAVGGAIGAGIGATAFGGQEVVEQQEVAPAPVVEGEVLADAPEAAPAPAPEPLPVISPEDAVLVKAQTQQTIDQIAGLPGGDLAVDAARNAALAAPQALEGLRGSIVAIGGEGVVVAVESAATAVAQATAPVGPNGELALETLTA
ncbi:hypothetical protein DW322_04335 [Rhodococcus rhodnii]|uniref:Glycine zipper domain-containing protein n=2 Tax=Rhodococcus rhodnii TaxID=38312 RepID=R7WJU2_9NOCA|nr:hypothetical protein [Rhodococcus rhodnii]EOM74259.1 hypothetical protein Rrhod_4403 [Rhodococcus rhodnii LMG 5362]TXG89591.1 hypothetical protein DW322_04335 [Rhodococcus rhodnii]